MAGSLKNFIYTTDDGDDFIITRDESNMEAVGGAVDLPNGASTLYKLPADVKPRSAVYRSADGLVTRDIVLCTEAATPTTPIIDAVSGLTLNLVRIKGEVRKIYIGEDSGLLDGDAT